MNILLTHTSMICPGHHLFSLWNQAKGTRSDVLTEAYIIFTPTSPIITYIPCALKAGCHSHTSHKICQVCRSISALLFTACTPCDWVYRLSIRIKRYMGHPFNGHSHVPPRGPVQQIRYVDLSPLSHVPPMELAGSRTGQKGKTVYSCWTAVLCINPFTFWHISESCSRYAPLGLNNSILFSVLYFDETIRWADKLNPSWIFWVQSCSVFTRISCAIWVCGLTI